MVFAIKHLVVNDTRRRPGVRAAGIPTTAESNHHLSPSPTRRSPLFSSSASVQSPPSKGEFLGMTARHHRGFTLLEVLTTLVLLGILAGGVVSVLPDSSNVNLGAEADLLKSHLRYAQIRAQGDTHEWRLAFNDSSNYQLGPVRVTGQGFVPDVVPGTEGNEGTLTDGVTASEALIIRFDSWGSPLNDDGTPLSADRTITLTAGTQTETITILAETGLIR